MRSILSTSILMVLINAAGVADISRIQISDLEGAHLVARVADVGENPQRPILQLADIGEDTRYSHLQRAYANGELRLQIDLAVIQTV